VNVKNHQHTVGIISVPNEWQIADRPQPLTAISGRLFWVLLLRSPSTLLQDTALGPLLHRHRS
jgi:hypothetical protein